MSTHPTDEQLSAFNDAQLDGTQMRSTLCHLEECAACRQSADSLQAIREALRSLPSPPAPEPQFWADTLRQMRVSELEQSRPAAIFTASRRRWAAGAAFTAMFCAVFAAPLVQGSLHPVTEMPAVDIADTVDVSSLMLAHAQSAARQPLADADRQTLLAADGDPLMASDLSNPDAAR